MTIIGRYGNTSHAPFVDAHLIIPALGLRGNVSFLLDTGADSTILAEVDSRRLGVDYSKLKVEIESFGIGGSSTDFLEPALLLLADGPQLHYYRIQLTVKNPDPALGTMPSLLGRDVVNRLKVSLEYAANNCHLDVVSSDGTL